MAPYINGLDDGDEAWSLAQLAGLDRKTLTPIALGYGIAGAGALAFVWLQWPLPIFLGALTFSLVAAFLGAPFERPGPLMVPVRVVLGVAVGTAFTPAILGAAGGLVLSLALLIPYSIALTLGGMYFFERVAGYSRPTAFFAAVPGGLTDVTTMAADVGADARAVVLVHATRIAFIVFTIPFFVQVSEGVALGGRMANVIHLWEAGLIDLLMLVALGVAGYWIARRLGLAGAALVGPMIVSAAIHAAGITGAKVPFEVLAFAQLTLGISLGLQFRGLSWRDLRTTMVWALSFAAILMVIAILISIPIAALTGADRLPVLLAFAPGGQAELSLLSMILDIDVAFVALHHLVRLAIVIVGAQMVFAWRKDWQTPSPA